MAQKIFVAVDNSSLFDIALNTYGSLDFIGKLIEDNPTNGLNFYPPAGTQFVWDDSLQISQTNAIIGGSGMFVGQKFATRPTDEPVANFAPINILPPTINGAVSIGSTLTAISGAWSGLPTPTLSFQWQSSTDGGNTWGNIVGQTASTYVLISGDDTKLIRVNQIAVNSLGTASRASSFVQPYATGGSSSIPPSVSVAATSFVAGGGAPVIGSYLVLAPGAWNGDGPITFTYEWTIGATVVGTAQVYQVQAADFGQSIVGKVIATNTFGTANSITTGITVVQIPVNTVAPVISGTDIVGSVLTTTNGTWTGNATITFAYQWLRNGNTIASATSSTYTLVLADMGQLITCRVTGTNSFGNAAAVSNSITPRYAPTNITAPLISGVTNTGSVLTAFEGVWQSFPTPTFAYNWQRSTNGGLSYSNLGVTTNTYTLVTADEGALIRVQVTATNSVTSTTTNSSPLGIPVPTVQRPENTVAPAVTGNPYIGQVLTTTNGTWNNSPTSFAYQWFRGTTPIGTNSNTYTLVTADTNFIITCRVTATNAGGSEPQLSNEIFAYDADFYAVILYAQSVPYTVPTVAQQQHFSRMVKELKDNSMWSNMDRFFVMAQNGGSNFGRINWRNPNLATELSIANAGAFLSNNGYLLNGTTQWISTNFTPSTNGVNYTLNNAGRYAYMMTRTASQGVNYAMDGNATQNNNYRRLVTSAQNEVKINGTANLAAALFTNHVGYMAITRADATNINNYVDTPTINTQAQASVSLPSEVQWIGRNAAVYYGGYIGWYAIGGAIPVADLITHKNIITKYMSNL